MTVCYIGTITCVATIFNSRLKVCKCTIYNLQFKIPFIVRIINAKFKSALFVLVESKHLNCAQLLGYDII